MSSDATVKPRIYFYTTTVSTTGYRNIELFDKEKILITTLHFDDKYEGERAGISLSRDQYEAFIQVLYNNKEVFYGLSSDGKKIYLSASGNYLWED